MKGLALLALSIALAVAQKQPTFATNWHAIEAASAAVFQGSYSYFGDMGYCCSAESNCEVQVEFVNGTFYFDFTHNRTRQDVTVPGPPATYISDYTTGKEMLVDPSSMDCLAYCPLDGETLVAGFLAPNSTDLGPAILNGKKVEKWMYQTKPLGPKSKWVVETSYVYVDQSVSPAIPVEENDLLTPFGFEIGAANTFWQDYVGSEPNPALFAVNGEANCPMSNGCNDDTSAGLAGMQRRLRPSLFARKRHSQEGRPTANDVKETRPPHHHKKHPKMPKRSASLPPMPTPLPAGAASVRKSTEEAQPTFPNDWTSGQEDWMVQYQGDYTQGEEVYCCSLESQCTVSTGYDNGIFYFDFTHNRTRFDDNYAMQTEIIDFTNQMDMIVDPTNMTCLNYCPLFGETLEPGFLDPTAKDMGQAVINGIPVEVWQWNDTFAFWVMETSDVFVDQSQTPAVPVQENDLFTPFGEVLGGGVTSWTNFTPGTPNPALFAVKGMSSCPQAGNCQEPTMQTRRVMRKLFKTWHHYEMKRRQGRS